MNKRKMLVFMEIEVEEVPVTDYGLSDLPEGYDEESDLEGDPTSITEVLHNLTMEGVSEELFAGSNVFAKFNKIKVLHATWSEGLQKDNSFTPEEIFRTITSIIDDITGTEEPIIKSHPITYYLSDTSVGKDELDSIIQELEEDFQVDIREEGIENKTIGNLAERIYEIVTTQNS